MINVFIIDDHPMFIDGVKVALRSEKKHVKILGSATSVKEGMSELEKESIDVVLLDLVMPEINGIECSLMMKKKFPQIKIIILTGEMDSILLYNAWTTGVGAILTKYCGKKELFDTIRDVVDGKRIIGQKVPEFFSHIGGDGQESISLTRREQQILNLLAQGHGRNEVADILFLSKAAIDFHCKNLFKKFDKSKIQSVISEARKAKLI